MLATPMSLFAVSQQTGPSIAEVERALASSIRRSEPDARRVYANVRGHMVVGWRERDGRPWEVAYEPQRLTVDVETSVRWSV